MPPAVPYHPVPIETTSVHLPDEVLLLAERLARNAHEVWARERIADGWTLGPVRDDANKRHPCLVAYDELPESEKKYDRRTVLEILKAIYAMGFRVVGSRDGDERP